MTEEELKNLRKDDKTEEIKTEDIITESVGSPIFQNSNNDIVFNLRTIRKPFSAEPPFKPRNWMDQIQPYKNGATIGLYFYIDGNWELFIKP